MKKINKTAPPLFSDFIKKNKPSNWTDCLEITADLRHYMLNEEQNGQCAYCESAIISHSSKSHIDHFRRKAGHLFPELVCAYENLLVSCNNPYRCAKHKDGEVKNKNDYDDLINPVTDNPTVHFNYSYTGDFIPIDEKGKHTIDIFKLNHKSLIERRKTMAMQVNTYKNQISLEDVKNIFKEFESYIENIWKN